MTIREMWRRLLSWIHRDRLAAELDEELRDHFELLARDLECAGLSHDDALIAARNQLGHTGFHREASRDAWGFPRVETILQDVRYAVRSLRRTPGFTTTAIVTLALGIGANAAMFAVIDRLMLRPIPHMKDPSTVGRVYLQITRQGTRAAWSTMPYTRYLDIVGAAHGVTDVAAISAWRLAVGTGPDTRIRKVVAFSASTWNLFDVRPVQGRFFGPADDVTPMGNAVVVVSYGYWMTEMGGGDVLGRRLHIGTIDFTVIGVAPQGFVGIESGVPDLFVPITTAPANVNPSGRDTYFSDYRWDWVDVLARRKPGVSIAAASAELGEAYRRSRDRQRVTMPTVLADSIAHPAVIFGSTRSAAGPDAGLESKVLLWVAGVAVIVLLIACANVTNLMLARILRRRREVAVRLALGVSRARLAGMFVTEGVLLAGVGGVAGLFVAQWGGLVIRAMLLPEGTNFNLAADWRTLTVTAFFVIVSALLTAIGPAVLAGRSELGANLKAGVREGTYRSSWLRSSLLVTQAALSVALLVGAGLFVRSLRNVLAIPLGYDVSTVLDIHPDFRGQDGDSASRVAIRRRLLATAQGISGVEAAARVNSALFQTSTTKLRVTGIDSVELLGRFNFEITTPDYFKMMQTRILRGRGFDQRDGEGSAATVVVSNAMARVLWPGKEALGQCIYVTWVGRLERDARCTTVIGIAEDAARQGIGDEARLMYYLSVDQVDPSWTSTVQVRMASHDIDGEIERVRRVMQAAMPGDGFVIVTPVQKRVDDQMAGWRLGATLFLVFGILALVIAAVGLYGVISYTVSQRMHEIGVRIALGAQWGDVVRLVVREGLAVGAVGVTIGLVLALVGSRWLQPLLYKESARDPVTYAGIAVIMLLVAVVASMMPALRAAGADPNRALRAD